MAKNCMGIDGRKHLICVLDTETANTRMEDGKLVIDSALMYDTGYTFMSIPDGEIYLEKSFVNRDVFVKERDLMRTAYYANKIPLYVDDLRNGERVMNDTLGIYFSLLRDCKDYGVHEICAHNARFDVNALNATIRYITKSDRRYFFPKDIEIWDSLKMARDVILKMPTYQKFCAEHGFLTKNGKPSATAENLYRFITKNPDFVESHTGLEDVRIEREIILYCYKQHKKMRKKLYEKA